MSNVPLTHKQRMILHDISEGKPIAELRKWYTPWKASPQRFVEHLARIRVVIEVNDLTDLPAVRAIMERLGMLRIHLAKNREEYLPTYLNPPPYKLAMEKAREAKKKPIDLGWNDPALM